jgi:hypothetical protein
MTGLPTDTWVEELAYRLMGGQRVILRLPPRVGKTFLLKKLELAIGPTAIYIDGNAFTDTTHNAQREALDKKIQTTVEEKGEAQVLFDSYDTAIARPGGVRLQNWLNHRLIDHEQAQDIGAIFTARCATKVERPGAGSPLLSRVQPIDPPIITNGTHVHALHDMQEWFGNSILLAEQSFVEGVFSPIAVADRCEQDLSYLKDVREAASEVLTRGKVEKSSDSVTARGAAHGLFTDTGPTRLYERLKTVLQQSPAMDPRWPSSFPHSVRKFVDMIAEAETVTWCDRYMYRDIEALRSFLQAVRAVSSCKVRLLGSSEVSDRVLSRAEMLRLSLLSGVEARFISSADHRDLHDRHLFIGPGGFVVPQVHVIVGRQSPGSAVAAAVSKFGVNYNEVWSRSPSL